MRRALALLVLATPILGRPARAQKAPDTSTVAIDLALRPAPWMQQDSTRRRRRSVEYSQWYGRRLTIHRLGSYAMLPLFAAEYYLGDKLIEGTSQSWVKPTHVAVAAGVGTLFTVNTVTGAWNLWDSRTDPAGRTRRVLHSALMLAADAGFVATGLIAEDASHTDAGARRHRNVALGSMALSTAGTAMMWIWKN